MLLDMLRKLTWSEVKLRWKLGWKKGSGYQLAGTTASNGQLLVAGGGGGGGQETQKKGNVLWRHACSVLRYNNLEQPTRRVLLCATTTAATARRPPTTTTSLSYVYLRVSY